MAAVRKKLQKVGNSHGIVLDRDLLAGLVPDGNLDAALLVEVVGSALVVRREDAPAPAPGEVERAATIAAPDLPGLTPTERLLLDALRSGAATRGEIADAVQRAPETVSNALKRLKGDGWVTQTGRDWRLTPDARRRLETDEGRRFAELPPTLARLALALEAGPLTAGEVAEALNVPRRTANALLARATRDGLVSVGGNATPQYALRACSAGSLRVHQEINQT